MIKHHDYLEGIKGYLDDNFKNRITLSMLSEKFYISKFYLVREYKKKYGITIFAYIQDKRIKYAQKLLSDTDMSIDEISSACGFKDQNYLARQFKKANGMTCSEYRKENRRKRNVR